MICLHLYYKPLYFFTCTCFLLKNIRLLLYMELSKGEKKPEGIQTLKNEISIITKTNVKNHVKYQAFDIGSIVFKYYRLAFQTFKLPITFSTF